MSITIIEPTPARAAPGLKPRRTLHRLATALAALALATLAQSFLGHNSLWDGLLLYALAAFLFGRTLAQRLPVGRPAAADDFSLALAGGWRRNVGVWLMLLAVGASVVAYRFFGRDDAPMQAWWLYAAGLALLIAGGLLLSRNYSWPGVIRNLRPNRQTAAALLIVLGIAALMRLINFTGQPFGIWYDEAEAGLQARQILTHPAYRPVFYPPINITGHLLALYALALNWFGNTIYAMRLVSVLFGLGGVLAAYLFGRELHGSRFGLTLAFLVAVARWHVNFSRIAMTGIDTSFFEFLTLYFLARLLRRGRLADALGVGLGLGFGLVFYTAFRLFVLTIVMAAAIGVVLWWPQLARSFSRGGWRSHMARLAVLGVAGWLVVMPMVQFALANPQAFWYRTNQISIFTKRDQANLGLALWQTTRQHLLMFNYQGDKNGRHNLPGEPMLDPLTGMLAVLGFALALARPRRPHHTFFLLLLPLGLVGGIFSVDFEAPQSLRSIAVFPAVMYFAALALAALGREAQESLAGVAPHWVTVPAAGLAGVMLFSNAHTYFIRQANDFASWNAFSAPETITGRKMAQLGPDTAYYLSPFLANHPTSRFIAPNITDQRALTLPDALPIRRPADRPAALFIHPDDVWVFDQAQQLYPNAAFEVARGRSTEDDAPPVVYMVILQPGDIAAVQGLELRYFSRDSAAADSPNQLPLLTVRAYAVNTTWPAESPVPGDFTAEWRGVLYAPQYGPYSFRLTTPGPATLEIDGNPVLEAQAGEHLVGLPLAEGNHAFRLRVQSGTGQVNLYWQPPGQAERLVPQWALYAPPVTNHGLLGSYYLNDRWEGQPAFQRVDPFLDMYFHFTPLPRPYTVAWEGMLDVPQSGLYRLGVRAVAEAQLFLDDQPALTTGQPDQTTETALTLNAGLHPIRLLFRDVTDRSRIHLLWATPATNLEPIPAQNLWPPLGRYPEKPASPPRADVKSLELRWLRSLGVPGAEPGQFFEPRDVAVLSTGHLVVADTVNRRVQLIDPQGTPLQTLTGSEFPFEEPLAVAVNSRDEILVLDSTLQWVYRYNAAGELLDRFGGPAAQLFHPRGLTVLADDRVVIADTGRSRLALFSPDGAQAGAIGGLGSGPGQFNEPIDALAGLQGAYFVAEAMNNRVQQVDAAGNHLGQWAIPPAYAFNGPHLAAGPDGSIFVTESQSRLLLRYAPDGSLLNQWTALGPVNLAAPVGIYVDTAANRLYLTDVWTHQVHIFEIAEQP